MNHFDIVNDCIFEMWIHFWNILTTGCMIVSVVDLLYVLGRSLFVRITFPT